MMSLSDDKQAGVIDAFNMRLAPWNRFKPSSKIVY